MDEGSRELRGSQCGNLRDCENIFGREDPWQGIRFKGRVRVILMDLEVFERTLGGFLPLYLSFSQIEFQRFLRITAPFDG